MNSRYLDFILTALLTLSCAVLFLIPTGFEETTDNSRSQRTRAQVDHVDNTDIRQNPIVKTGLQELTVIILNGPFKGHRDRAGHEPSARQDGTG